MLVLCGCPYEILLSDYFTLFYNICTYLCVLIHTRFSSLFLVFIIIYMLCSIVCTTSATAATITTQKFYQVREVDTS